MEKGLQKNGRWHLFVFLPILIGLVFIAQKFVAAGWERDGLECGIVIAVYGLIWHQASKNPMANGESCQKYTIEELTPTQNNPLVSQTMPLPEAVQADIILCEIWLRQPTAEFPNELELALSWSDIEELKCLSNN